MSRFLQDPYLWVSFPSGCGKDPTWLWVFPKTWHQSRAHSDALRLCKTESRSAICTRPPWGDMADHPRNNEDLETSPTCTSLAVIWPYHLVFQFSNVLSTRFKSSPAKLAIWTSMNPCLPISWEAWMKLLQSSCMLCQWMWNQLKLTPFGALMRWW